jgi:hypothetical protein
LAAAQPPRSIFDILVDFDLMVLLEATERRRRAGDERLVFARRPRNPSWIL